MFCGNCGAEIPDDTQFCPNCGATQKSEVKEEVAQAGEKKPFPVKLVAGVVAVLVVLVLLFSLVGGNGGSKKAFTYPKGTIMINSDYMINLTGKMSELEDSAYDTYYSANMKTSLYKDKDGTLYLVGKDFKTQTIAENVDLVMPGIDGNYIVYTAYDEDNKDDNKVEELCIYDVKKKKNIKVDKGVYGPSVAMSPNGKMVAYLKEYEDSTNNEMYLAGASKKAKKIGKDGKYPIAVSNDGKKVFYKSSDEEGANKLYLYAGKSEDLKIEKSGVSGYNFYVNSDGTQIVYNKDGKSYLYKGGKEAIKISGNSIDGFLDNSLCGAGYEGVSSCATVYNASSFKNAVFVASGDSGYGYYWINNAAKESVKIVSSPSDIEFATDMKSCVYVKDGKVYKIAKFDENMKDKLLYDEDKIKSIYADAKLSKVFAVNSDKEFIYIKGVNKENVVCDDFDSVSVDRYTGTVYLVVDDELMTAGTGKGSAKKFKKIKDEVQYVNAEYGVVSVMGKDDVNYLISGGKVYQYEEP